MVMNVATYGFTMVAARLLGPRPYGAFASVMALILVISVLQLGLQATAARRISADPAHVAQIERNIMQVTYRSAWALGALLLVLTPVVNLVLRLDDWPTAVLVAICAVPLTITGGQAGILQGERRWWPLAVLYMAMGVPRLVVGTSLIWWHPSEFLAMLGVTIGALAPVAVGWYALRRPRDEGVHADHHGTRAIVREIVHNSQALLAFFALSNADIIVARNVLDEHDAGLYAGGLILTKAVLFLPQFVVVVAFPAMATASERRRALTRSLAFAGVLGIGATGGAALLSGLAMVFVGGQEYAEIEGRLWLFAVLGTLLAMLQLLIYSVLARQGQRSVYLVWVALIALVGAGLTVVDSLESMLAVVVVVDGALFAILFGLSLWVVRHPLPEADASEAGPEALTLES